MIRDILNVRFTLRGTSPLLLIDKVNSRSSPRTLQYTLVLMIIEQTYETAQKSSKVILAQRTKRLCTSQKQKPKTYRDRAGPCMRG